MGGVREQYKRALGDVKDLTRYLRDRNEETEMINIRYIETSSDLKGEILYPVEAKSKMETRE